MVLNFDTDLEWMTGGLDLAASGKDFSTLVLAELYEVATGEKNYNIFSGEEVGDITKTHYVVRGIHRWPLGTPPGDVVADAASIMDEPEFAACEFRYDATGMGAGVSTLVRDLRYVNRFPGGIRGLTITGGAQSQTSGTVPKLDLVSTLSRLLHEERLHVLECELAEAWRIEMNSFQAKVTSAGNVKFEAQTEAIHDDLVMATALAVINRRNGFGPRRGRQVPLSYLRQTILGAGVGA